MTIVFNYRHFKNRMIRSQGKLKFIPQISVEKNNKLHVIARRLNLYYHQLMGFHKPSNLDDYNIPKRTQVNFTSIWSLNIWLHCDSLKQEVITFDILTRGSQRYYTGYMLLDTPHLSCLSINKVDTSL